MSSPNHTPSSESSHEEPIEAYLEESRPVSPLFIITSDPWDETPPHPTHEETEDHSHSTKQPLKYTARITAQVPEPTFTCSPTEFFPLPKQTDLDRWLWMRDIIEFWQKRDGSPYDMAYESSPAPVCQVTGEPTHHTIPVLVNQVNRQETAIEQMQYHLEAMPDFSTWEGMRQEISAVEYNCRGLRKDFEKAGKDRGKVAWLEGRLINVENGLDRLRASIDGLHKDIASIFMELRESKKKDY